MKKSLIMLFFFVFLAALGIAQTQHCPEYDQILQNLRRVYSKNLLDSALLQVRYLRACTPNDEILADQWTEKIFDKINQQKLEAKAAQNKAEASEKKATAALNRANRLISYFNFGNEEAGWAYQNGLFAVIDREGNQLTDYIYSTPDTFSNGIALTKVNGQFVFLDYMGKEITERYDFIALQSNDIYYAGSEKMDYGGFRKINKICLCQVMSAKPTKDKIIELNVYPYFFKLNEHLFLAPTKDSLWVRLNERGCKIGHSPYKEINADNYWMYKNGIVAVKIDSLWGFIDSLENWVIRPQFKEIYPFGEGVDVAKRDSLEGIIDSLIGLVIPPKFDNLYASNDNYLVPAKQDSLWGFIDKLGYWRIRPQYSQVERFQNGLAKVTIGDSWKDRKCGVIDTTGEIKIPIEYHDIFMMPENGFGWVDDGDYYYFVDSIGQKIDSIFNHGPWFGISDKCWVGGKERDSTILVFSDGRVLHWSPNEGIKGIGDYNDKIDFAIKKNGTWYYADSSRIHDSEIHLWDDIYFEQNGLARVRRDTLWGLIDSTGQLIKETQFKYISDFENGFAKIQSAKDTLWGVINTTGQIIVEPKFEEIGIDNFPDTAITIRKGELWGYINSNKHIYLEPQFNVVYTMNDEGALAIILKDTFWGRINYAGQIIMDKEIEESLDTILDQPPIIISPDTLIKPGVISSIQYGNGLTKFRQGNLWGIRDSNEQVVIEARFNHISEFEHGLAPVRKDSLWGYINKSGKVVLEPQFNHIFGFEHGLAPVRKGNLEGYIDTTGKVVVEPQFNETYAFTCGLAPVQKDNHYGYVDTTGQIFRAPQFDFVYNFKHNIAWVKKDTLWGLLDIKGNYLLDPQYNNIIIFKTGLVAIQRDSLWGFIDSVGHILVEPKFDEIKGIEQTWASAEVMESYYYHGGIKDRHIDFKIVQPDKENGFQSELIPIRKGNLLGLADKTGQVVLPIQFSRIEAFQDGFAIVEQSRKKGLIDMQFKLVIPCEFSNLHHVSLNNFMPENKGRYGLFNAKYKVYIPAEYEAFGFTGEEFGWVRAKKNGKWGWVDQLGKVKIPFRYDASMPFKNGKAWVLQEPKEEFFEINQEGKMIVDY